MAIRIRHAVAAAGVLAWAARRFLGRRFDLRNRVCLITGGSRGLGLAIARELASAGARIAICGRTSEDLVFAKQDLEERGARVLALPCDVTDPVQVATLVEETRRQLGPIDVLVNNAGIIVVGPVESLTRADFEKNMATTFWGAFNMTEAVIDFMRARGEGRIVNVTSIGGEVALPHLLAYTSAKFALQGYSAGLRSELAKDGIVVTTVIPGLMRTGSPLNATFKGDAGREIDWFAAGDASPLTAMSAQRAARRIVRALVHGEAQVTLSWQARVLRFAHAVVPSLTTDLLGAVNRLLPRSRGGVSGVKGRDLLPRKPFLRSLLARPMRDLNNERQ